MPKLHDHLSAARKELAAIRRDGCSLGDDLDHIVAALAAVLAALEAAS